MADYQLTTTDYVIRTKDAAWVPNDPRNRNRQIYDAWLAAGNIPDPYVEPPAPVPTRISDRQFFQQLAVSKAITADEALAAVKIGEVPAALQAFMNTLPGDQKFAADMLLSGATIFERSHPMTAALAAGMGWKDSQIDDLWRAAAKL